MNNLLAQEAINNPFLGESLQGMTGAQFVGSLISTLISLALLGGAIIFVFILIIGGISWISAGGDKASVEAARSKVTNALIGIVVLFSVWAIIGVVERVFGISILAFDILDFAIK